MSLDPATVDVGLPSGGDEIEFQKTGVAIVGGTAMPPADGTVHRGGRFERQRWTDRDAPGVYRRRRRVTGLLSLFLGTEHLRRPVPGRGVEEPLDPIHVVRVDSVRGCDTGHTSQYTV